MTLRAGFDFDQPVGQVQPVHPARKRDVGEEQVHLPRCSCHCCMASSARPASTTSYPRSRSDSPIISRSRAKSSTSRSSPRPGRCPRPELRGAGPPCLPRAGNPERGALARRAVRLDPPPMLHDNPVDHRQPEARALVRFLRREERFERVRERFLAHAAPGVGDREAQEPARTARSYRPGLALADLDGRDVQRDRPPVRHRIARVHSQVHDDLLEHAGVRLHCCPVCRARNRTAGRCSRQAAG